MTGMYVIDLILAWHPQGRIISTNDYGFYMDYAPDHFYAWKDEGITWKYGYIDSIPRSHSY